MALAAALLVLPLTGCNGGSGSGDTIKIGGLAPLTGEVAQYGTAVDNAVKMAVDKINETGILGGKKIEYISYDERGTPARPSPCTSGWWTRASWLWWAT